MKKRKPSEHFQFTLDETTKAGLELSGSVLASIIVASAIERAAHIIADAIKEAAHEQRRSISDTPRLS